MSEARMTPTEERDLRAAFERDKWAGEWNSLPTAIDSLLAARLAAVGRDTALREAVEALANEWERTTVRARPAFLVAADELRAALDQGQETK